MTTVGNEVVVVPEVVTDPRLAEAQNLVKRYSCYGAGMGIVPVPLLDLAGLVAIQAKMLGELSKMYGVHFKEDRAKKIAIVLFGSIGTGVMLTGFASSLAKIIPGVGTFAGNLGFAAVAASSTYAVGKVFILHFESGGTFLDFDPEKMKAAYAQQFKEGQKMTGKAKASAA